MRASRTRLRAALAPPARALLAAAAAEADARGAALWAVGGAVRDCAAGLPVRDVDLALEAPTHAAVRAFAGALAARVGGRVRAEAPELGTVELDAPGGRLDLAALRTERYAGPGALPTAALGASVEDDLARRDFTVNAIAIALAGPRRGALVDPFDGLGDLAARRLRVLHARSFVDDATRLWRGARTAAPLRLRPDAETATLIGDGARWLAAISGERLCAELRYTLARRSALAALRLLDAWGVLAGTAPGWRLAAASARVLRAHPGPHDEALGAALAIAPLAARGAILDRLRPARAVRDAVDGAAALLAERGVPGPERLEALAATPQPARRAARWLDPRAQAPLQRALRRWERTRPALDAEALIALGVRRGPALGRALACLRRERYLGNLSGVREARAAVRAHLAGGVR